MWHKSHNNNDNKFAGIYPEFDDCFEPTYCSEFCTILNLHNICWTQMCDSLVDEDEGFLYEEDKMWEHLSFPQLLPQNSFCVLFALLLSFYFKFGLIYLNWIPLNWVKCQIIFQTFITDIRITLMKSYHIICMNTIQTIGCKIWLRTECMLFFALFIPNLIRNTFPTINTNLRFQGNDSNLGYCQH